MSRGTRQIEPLTDNYGRQHRYLRVSLTDRCNFRCQYCMPEEDIEWAHKSTLLSFEEIERVARALAPAGVNKIRLTGGEPTVRKGLTELIAQLAQIDGIDSLSMTTNGWTLAQKATEYREAGLNSVNVSLDSLREDRFQEITQRSGMQKVVDGVDAAIDAGLAPVKLNVVVMSGVNHDELADFVEFTRDRPVDVRFIEFMPFAGNRWKQATLYPYARMVEDLEARFEIKPLNLDPGAIAKEFKIEGFAGQFGFITSMTQNFCSGCDRIRLTADGQIKVCLFGREEADLRGMLRDGCSEEDIVQAFRDALKRKAKQHLPLTVLSKQPNRSMVAIGG